MKEPKPKVDCPINLFGPQDEKIRRYTEEINQVEPALKAGKAEEMLKEIQVLLDCESFDKKNVHCQNCQTTSQLRKQTAELIIKTRKIM